MPDKPKLKLKITRVRLNSEQAVLACCYLKRNLAYEWGESCADPAIEVDQGDRNWMCAAHGKGNCNMIIVSSAINS